MTVNNGQLKSFVERIERLLEEKKSISEDVSEVYNEAGSMGYDKKILRKVVNIRNMDSGEREEQEALLEVYMNALDGVVPSEDDS